jgi:hypothetical protein
MSMFHTDYKCSMVKIRYGNGSSIGFTETQPNSQRRPTAPRCPPHCNAANAELALPAELVYADMPAEAELLPVLGRTSLPSKSDTESTKNTVGPATIAVVT